MLSHLFASPLGAAIGIVLGLTGAGGAVLSVPALTLILGLPFSEAAPIGLLAVTVAAGLGAAITLRQGILRYKAAGLMAAAGFITSPLGVMVSHALPEALLTGVFSLLLLWIGVSALRQLRAPAGSEPPHDPPCKRNPATGKFIWTGPCMRVLAGAGLATGFLSGLLGVGGGFLLIPALKRYSDLPVHACIATSMGVLTLVSALGVAVSLAHQPLNLAAGTPFIVGAVAGLLIGRTLSSRFSEARLRLLFALLCLSVAVAMGGSLVMTR